MQWKQHRDQILDKVMITPEMYNFFCTYEVQDPAHSAVPSAGQHSEIRNISEEVQPANKHTICTLLPHNEL